ncbi:uncharacterized protein ACIQIH_010118 isoform 3-T3 [Cyanocitta cristata]
MSSFLEMVFRLDPQNLESGRLQCRSIPSSRLLQCWQDEEARPAEEEDEEVWEDGDSGHQRLGKAQIQMLGLPLGTCAELSLQGTVRP